MPNQDTVIYAIGDVHGEAERLHALHEHIFERHTLSHPDMALKIIHLGDYVDRGPDSCGAIEAVMAIQTRKDAECICLRGNHEDMMLRALTEDSVIKKNNWLENGGRETLASYKKHGQEHVPSKHIDWIASCPAIQIEPEHNLIFVHAGIAPATYPHEDDAVYLWTRADHFFDVKSWENPALEGWTVVHGHTPTSDFFPDHVEAKASRLNLDTGAVFGGRLTAAIFAPGEPVGFMYT